MKKLLKNLLIFTLTLSLLFSLWGCSKDEGDTDKADDEMTDGPIDNTEGLRMMEEIGFTAADGKCYAVIEVKNFGTIVVELLPDYAPITVDHFLSVANKGVYTNTTFHRILSDFMIQGGASNKNVATVVGEFAANGYRENTLAHERGVISMARTNEMNSATSQFFICNADYPSLNGYYAAFGRVVLGMDVVDAITEYGMNHTTQQQNGIIDDASKRPVILRIAPVDLR